MPYSDDPVSDAPPGTRYVGNNIVSTSPNTAAMANMATIPAGASPAGSPSPGMGPTLSPTSVISTWPTGSASEALQTISNSSPSMLSATSSAPYVSPSETRSQQIDWSNGGPYAPLSAAQQQVLIGTANRIGAPDPAMLYGVINYETEGTFSPDKLGLKGKDGVRMRGLIQMDGYDQKKYGIKPGMSFEDQMDKVAQYLVDRGYKPGMDLAHMYSIVNAGSLTKSGQPRWDRGDVNGNLTYHVAQITEHFYPKDYSATQAVAAADAPVPTPRERPARGNPLTVPDMNAAPGQFADSEAQKATPKPFAGPEPFTPDVPATGYGKFVADLQAGKVPWEQLPPAWQTDFGNRFGANARQVYEMTRSGGNLAFNQGGAGDPVPLATPTQATAFADPGTTAPVTTAAEQMATAQPITPPPAAAAPTPPPVAPAEPLLSYNGPEPAPAAPPPGQYRPDQLLTYAGPDGDLPTAAQKIQAASAPKPPPAPIAAIQAPTLTRGMRNNPQIRAQQMMLAAAGYYGGRIDGDFGPQTQKAVSRFRPDHGLPDGKVIDPQTAAAIQQTFANQTQRGHGKPAAEVHQKAIDDILSYVNDQSNTATAATEKAVPAAMASGRTNAEAERLTAMGSAEKTLLVGELADRQKRMGETSLTPAERMAEATRAAPGAGSARGKSATGNPIITASEGYKEPTKFDVNDVHFPPNARVSTNVEDRRIPFQTKSATAVEHTPSIEQRKWDFWHKGSDQPGVTTTAIAGSIHYLPEGTRRMLTPAEVEAEGTRAAPGSTEAPAPDTAQPEPRSTGPGAGTPTAGYDPAAALQEATVAPTRRGMFGTASPVQEDINQNRDLPAKVEKSAEFARASGAKKPDISVIPPDSPAPKKQTARAGIAATIAAGTPKKLSPQAKNGLDEFFDWLGGAALNTVTDIATVPDAPAQVSPPPRPNPSPAADFMSGFNAPPAPVQSPALASIRHGGQTGKTQVSRVGDTLPNAPTSVQTPAAPEVATGTFADPNALAATQARPEAPGAKQPAVDPAAIANLQDKFTKYHDSLPPAAQKELESRASMIGDAAKAVEAIPEGPQRLAAWNQSLEYLHSAKVITDDQFAQWHDNPSDAILAQALAIGNVAKQWAGASASPIGFRPPGNQVPQTYRDRAGQQSQYLKGDMANAAERSVPSVRTDRRAEIDLPVEDTGGHAAYLRRLNDIAHGGRSI